MKKVIDGKLYNTETAEEIGSYSYSHSTDFNYVEETLYRTKKGAFFTVGEGGPMSKYSRSLGNNSTGGSSDIFTALSISEALEWCEENDVDAEIIAQYFEDKIEEA